MSETDELLLLKRLLDTSLDARRFTDSAKAHGFRFVDEGPLGLKMESKRGTFMLGVFRSVHSSNIGTLVYRDNASGESACLVDGGRRQYETQRESASAGQRSSPPGEPGVPPTARSGSAGKPQWSEQGLLMLNGQILVYVVGQSRPTAEDAKRLVRAISHPALARLLLRKPCHYVFRTQAELSKHRKNWPIFAHGTDGSCWRRADVIEQSDPLSIIAGEILWDLFESFYATCPEALRNQDPQPVVLRAEPPNYVIAFRNARSGLGSTAVTPPRPPATRRVVRQTKRPDGRPVAVAPTRDSEQKDPSLYAMPSLGDRLKGAFGCLVVLAAILLLILLLYRAG